MIAVSEPTQGAYSPTCEARSILDYLCRQSKQLNLPSEVVDNKDDVEFYSATDEIYFPIPFKETETISALKAVEGLVASAIADLRYGKQPQRRKVRVSLERATSFAFQAYRAKVDGLGKLDENVKNKLKDTDLLQAQSIPYRRMSANLYRTKSQGEFYHIHGSLEANTTLKMLGLEPYRPDLTDYDEIIRVIENRVQKYTTSELEKMNEENRQAGVTAYKYDDFIRTPHGSLNITEPPWDVSRLEWISPPAPFPGSTNGGRLLEGVRVLELCRIIAGPTIGRILAEYGADVMKITSPNLSDVPFFQVDGNMGKHAADLDLKKLECRKIFEELLLTTDVLIDGYRPGALDKLGYGPNAIASLAEKRGKGIVYVNENCFGYKGEWAGRPGWQQIADCVTGIAWAQGAFMGLNAPVVPPFPISDYGTGCMGAIAALTGLYHRSKHGGSYHAKASLVHYDLLLFAVGQYPSNIQDTLRSSLDPEFLKLRHYDSVDRISATALRGMEDRFPHLFISPNRTNSNEEPYTEEWFSQAYGARIEVVRPVAEITGIDNSFKRASRPNGNDRPCWEDFQQQENDYRSMTGSLPI